MNVLVFAAAFCKRAEINAKRLQPEVTIAIPNAKRRKVE
jgi:hypothetical protein